MSIPEKTDLAPEYSISRVIKGGWQLAGGHGSVDAEAAVEDMIKFVDAGIFTFDCADIYTGVEEMIGRFISRVRESRGNEAADGIRVHTKLVPDLDRLDSLTPREVEKIIDRSLARLGTDRLDLVQFYWWDLARGRPETALETLQRCQQAGKIRHLGVTNWDVAETARFVDAGFDFISTQIQYSLLDQRPTRGLSEWCLANDVGMLCYGTLAGGFLTDSWLGRPDPGFEFENRSLVKYRLVIDEFGSWKLFQELLAILKQISERHGVSLSAVATRWVLDQPGVAAAIVGARYARHLPRTLEVFEFSLTGDDLAQIEAVLNAASGIEGSVYGAERQRDGRHGRIMKYNLNDG